MAGRFQIKLSTLFVLILAISLPLGCIAYVRHQIDDFLTETRITDAGLVHLRQLRGLTSLALAGTQVTDAGVEELKQSLPKREIFR